MKMNKDELLARCLEEERMAHIKGWEFSHIDGRWQNDETLPWDYRECVQRYLAPTDRLLDIDTGGGEALLSFGHPHELTAATEAYPPNVRLCMETLAPLGIDIREADGGVSLPFEDEYFDIVINRHGAFNAAEICRVLKKGGVFVTQQVGADNDRELAELLVPEAPAPFPEARLSVAKASFAAAGMTVIEEGEAFRPIRFFEIGALVWFARVIEWEFPDFLVERCFERLCAAQELIEKNGSVDGHIHRYMLVARK